MQAVGAHLQKLVMTCYGVLRNWMPLDTKWPRVGPAARDSPVDPRRPDQPRKRGVDTMPPCIFPSAASAATFPGAAGRMPSGPRGR